MIPVSDPEAERRGELLLDLLEAAEQIQRENLRRRYPEATREEIERRLRDWYLTPEDDLAATPFLREIPAEPR